jgi:hypothetical protein
MSVAIAQVQYQIYGVLAQRQGEVPNFSPPADSRAIAAQMTAPPALIQLCHQFGLSDFECQVLLLCAGRAINPEFPKLCALLHDDPRQDYVTFQLALQVFVESHWRALTPGAPLRHWQLLNWAPEEDIPHARLSIDEGILHYLLGEPYDDPLLRQSLRPLPHRVEVDQLAPSHGALAQQVARLFHHQPTAKVQLCGPEADPRWAIASAVAQLAHRDLYSLNPKTFTRDPADVLRFAQRWQRWVRLAPSLLLVDLDSLAPAEGEASPTSAVDSLLSILDAPVLLSTAQRHHVPQCALVNLDVPRLSYGEQLTLWHQALGPMGDAMNGQLNGLVSQFNLSPRTIEAAGLSVQAMGSGEGLEADAAASSDRPDTLSDRLWQFCRLQARPQLDNLAQRIDTTATWEDLILPDREKSTLYAISSQVQYRAQVYETWGFAGKSQRGLGISVMFAGQSGTGKTMAAEVLAQQFRLDLYRIDLSTVVSKYIGETEKNLRRIFDAAESGGAVLLFDEADALFGKRTEVKDSHDRHANVEVSYLLQRMESYQGLAILTTNLKKSLDQAFLRRIRFIVDFPFPDRDARTEIWRRAFPPQTPTVNLKYEKLGNLNVAGGNIRTIALNAAFLAAAAGTAVQMEHILQATQQEYLKLERSLTDAEVKGWLPRAAPPG